MRKLVIKIQGEKQLKKVRDRDRRIQKKLQKEKRGSLRVCKRERERRRRLRFIHHCIFYIFNFLILCMLGSKNYCL